MGAASVDVATFTLPVGKWFVQALTNVINARGRRVRWAREGRPSRLLPRAGTFSVTPEPHDQARRRQRAGTRELDGVSRARGRVQDTANNDAVTILFGGEDFDPGGNFDPGASRYTAPVAGYYEFNTTVALCCAGGRAFAVISPSRAGMAIRGVDINLPVNSSQVVASGLMRLQLGDTVSVGLYTARTTGTAASRLTLFSGRLVAAG